MCVHGREGRTYDECSFRTKTVFLASDMRDDLNNMTTEMIKKMQHLFEAAACYPGVPCHLAAQPSQLHWFPDAVLPYVQLWPACACDSSRNGYVLLLHFSECMHWNPHCCGSDSAGVLEDDSRSSPSSSTVFWGCPSVPYFPCLDGDRHTAIGLKNETAAHYISCLLI